MTKLWRGHKLSHVGYLALSSRLRDGHGRRKACVDAVIATGSAANAQRERALARKAIAQTSKPFRPLSDQIQAWRLQCHEKQERYLLLVLFGPSRTGKSRLARALHGDACTLVVDVQHAEHPDLRSYQRAQHHAVLFDEVHQPTFITGNKKVLQAHADGAILGQSATQLFSYEVFLWRTPLMLTTNNWDLSKLTPSDRNWIDENCVAVCIDQPVWQQAQRRWHRGRPELVASGPSVDRPWWPTPVSEPDAPAETPTVLPEATSLPLVVENSPSADGPEHKVAARMCSSCGQRLPRRTELAT